MAQSEPVLKPDDVAELLKTLHANGYRLRKLGPDSLEVDELGPKLQLGGEEPAQKQDEPEVSPDDDAMWDHVNGRPAWLKKPERKASGSPWKDNEAD